MALDPLPCSVAVVGGGVAGLSLATELTQIGIEDVLVIEREHTAGGVTRHCGHYPFGLREFKRLLKGPDYAARLVRRAEEAGVRICTGFNVTKLHRGGNLSVSGQHGEQEVQANRVVLCTGTRESTRAQRFLSGQRPQGVLPTGALQSLAYLHAMRPFRRPVILGTELVSMSAITTCKHMGIKPVAMLEENSRTTVPSCMRAYPMVHRIPLFLHVSDLQIQGDRCVQSVEFKDAAGQLITLDTDGVLVTGQFRPESALLRGSHLLIDSATGGPVVDQFYRTSDPAYYCTGNLLRSVENSGWCWHEGKATARVVAEDLASATRHETSHSVNLELDHPALKLVVPQRIAASVKATGMSHLQIRVNQRVNARLLIKTHDEVVWSGKLDSLPERRRLIPIAPLLDYANRIDAPATLRLSLDSVG